MNGHTICATFWRSVIERRTESVHDARFDAAAAPTSAVGRPEDAHAPATSVTTAPHATSGAACRAARPARPGAHGRARRDPRAPLPLNRSLLRGIHVLASAALEKKGRHVVGQER